MRTGALVAAAFPAAIFCAGFHASAQAEPYELIGAIGVETAGAFRGVKSDRPKPAVYGYAEFVRGDVVLGLFANPVYIQGERNALVLGYAEWRPSIGFAELQLGGQYYAFPDSSDFTYDLDGDGVVDHSGRKGLFEAKAGLQKKFNGGRLRLRVYYTPDGFAETGPAWYGYGEARTEIAHGFEARATFGVSRFDDLRYNENYADYSVGLFKSIGGFDVFVRYSDTAGLSGPDNRAVIFGVERFFTLASSERDERRRYRKIINDWRIDKSRLRGVR